MRPYWKRHPYQLRFFELMMLITLPISLTAFLLISYHEEIAQEVKDNIIQIWRVFTGKEKP